MKEILFLIFSLLMILASAEVFTNGIECFGRRLRLSQAVVGSILAAVGTALPETILPLVAILMYGGEAAKKIGVGAILGAPFMLSTLAFFLIGLSALVGYLRKRRKFELLIETHSIKRDLCFFIGMYSSSIFLPLLIHGSGIVIAVLLVAGYMVYAFMTFKGESSDILHADELYFGRLTTLVKGPSNKNLPERKEEGIPLIVFQVMSALALMIGGAHVFVGSLGKLSSAWGVNPMLFSLLVAPVATELPEKFNSVTWTLKGRDMLAMGNVTGAMVFQSTFPITVGLLFTDWNISGFALFSAVLALCSAVVVLVDISIRNRLSPVTVLLGGCFYLIYATVLIFGK